MRSFPARSAEAAAAGREQGVDLVRAAALVRVVVFHAAGNLPILTIIPAMPVMFFLGGTYIERSLTRRPYPQVLRSRVLRLVIPGAAYVVLTLLGLAAFGHSPGDLLRALAESIVPTHHGLGTGDTVADWMYSTLWYLRDYIAFALASPLLMRLLKAWPRATLTASVALLAIGAVSGVADATAMYLGFWMLGMSQIAARLIVSDRRSTIGWASVGTAVVGALLVIIGWDTWLATLGVSLAGIGWIAGLQHQRANLDRIAAGLQVQRAVEWLMARAVSVYLWQMVPVVVCFRLAVGNGRSLEGVVEAAWTIPVVLFVTMVLAWMFGPLERRARNA